MALEIIHRLPNSDPQPVSLLFVHGVSHGAWCWADHFLGYFASHSYPSYAMSLRGHGGSSGSLTRIRIRDYVADVDEAIRTLPQPPVLIGHSMGALIVQKYLEQQPPVRGGVFMAALPRRLSRLTIGGRLMRRVPGPLVRLFILGDWGALNDSQVARITYFSKQTPQDIVEACSRRLGNESMVAFYDMLMIQPLYPERVKVPVLVIGAEYDPIIAPNQSAAVAKAYHAPLVILPGMGHDMMLEPGWQQAADAILGWLTDCGF